MKLSEILKNEYKQHKWEYLSFSILVFVSWLAAWVVDISGISYVIGLLLEKNFSVVESIRNTPFEHFAQDTIAYSMTMLYVYVCAHRILLAFNNTTLTFSEKNVINPIIKFNTILCRTMIGGLTAVAILAFFSRKTLGYHYSFFLLIFIQYYMCFTHDS